MVQGTPLVTGWGKEAIFAMAGSSESGAGATREKEGNLRRSERDKFIVSRTLLLIWFGRGRKKKSPQVSGQIRSTRAKGKLKTLRAGLRARWVRRGTCMTPEGGERQKSVVQARPSFKGAGCFVTS